MTDNNALAETRKQIGDFLRRRREEQGLSKYAMIKAAGWYHSGYIDKIETGSQPYTIDTLLRYLQAAGMCIFFAPKGEAQP